MRFSPAFADADAGARVQGSGMSPDSSDPTNPARRRAVIAVVIIGSIASIATSKQTQQGTATLPPIVVVAFIGDNIQDFPKLSQAIKGSGDAAFTEFGSRFFVIPNPMYGSWEPR